MVKKKFEVLCRLVNVQRYTVNEWILNEVEASIRGQICDSVLIGKELSKYLEKIWEKEDKYHCN